MTMDREKDRDAELENAMYTNCLILGIDPLIIGVGANNGTPRVGLFKHSNPKLGEQLLYFILSSLRGPKEFDKVWPIFDSTQSREFRKVVHSIISELESQGALPRSNSRVSLLATCCGPRFVELLWQLSLHALREVHRRTYAADVASNPLPASLTDVAFSHAAALLPVTKARIALERRKFLKNAETAVQRQAMWSSSAHEMTAEYRGLCAEVAYLQQELEKLHDLRNKVKTEGEPWDELVYSSSQNSHLVQRATHLWDSLLSRKSQHEVLASGPIEDLIAHREHRYRISGSTLLAAMDEGSSSDEKTDRSGRGPPTVDIAEVIRRWTHAQQRILKQTLHLAKANDGEGPDLLRGANDGGTSGHAESLGASLAEHRQLLASIQESSSSEVTDVALRLSSVYIDKVSSSTAALKLPPLFSLTPNTTAESGNFNKRQAQVHTNQLEYVYEKLPHEQTVSSNQVNTPDTDIENNNYIRNLKKSAREAALATRASIRGQLQQDNHSDDGSEHFFVPLSGTGFSRMGPEKKPTSLRSTQLFVTKTNSMLVENHVPVEMANEYDGVNGYKPAAASSYEDSEGRLSFYDMEETHAQVFSPPFLMDVLCLLMRHLRIYLHLYQKLKRH